MAGIRIEGVGGDVELSASGDIIGGDKIEIVNHITTIQISAAAVVSRPLIATSPYRGLHRFDERDREVFFGRDQLVKNLLDRLNATSLLMVLGASGSGKSSLVRAGVLPALGNLLGHRPRYFVLVPDVDPFESLRSALMAGGFSQADTRPLLQGQADDAFAVIQSLHPPGEPWLFFVDQFEETFTRTAEPLRTQFIASLLSVTREPAGATKVVLAMRADFLERLSPFPEFAKRIENNLQLVTDMHADELRLAIEQPAARHGVMFESGLIEEIIQDVQGQAGPLPLLQYTLNLLWEEARQGGFDHRTLGVKEYRELGGVRGALEQRADAMYAALDERRDPPGRPQQEIVRQIFLRLVDIAAIQGADDAPWRPVRRRVPMASFPSAEERTALAILIDHKLLVSDVVRPSAGDGTSGGEPGEASVEVAHEALFTSWARLRSWIGAARRVIFVKNRLADDSVRWGRIHADDELWTGSRLDEALELRARGDFATVVGGLIGEENRFLDDSAGLREKRRLAAERQRRRIRRGLVVGLGLVLAFSGFAVYQWSAAATQRDETEIRRQMALSGRLATQALDQLRGGSLDSALLLALEARNVLTASRAATTANTFDARSSLFAALTYGAVPIDGYLRGGNLFAFSPDGKTLALARADRIVLWDVKTRRPIGRPLASHGDAVLGLAFSPDGKRLASSGRSNNNLILWNLDTREPDGLPLTDHDGAAITVAFSPDGKLLATGGPGAIHLWDPQTRQQISPPLLGHGANVVSLAFSPDGQLLASGSWDGTVMLWDVAARRPLGQPLQAREPFGQVESVAFSPDGKTLASGGGGGILLWDVTTRQAIDPPMIHAGGVKSVAFSLDGTLLASGSGGTVGTVILWRVATREPIGPALRGHKRGIEVVAFRPKGKTLASSDGGDALASSDGGDVLASSDGGDVLASSDGGDVVLLWDLASLHRLGTVFSGYAGPADAVAISRDRAVVASGICMERDASSKDCLRGGIGLWNLTSREQLRTWPTGCPNAPTGLVFRDSSNTLVSVGCATTDRGDCKGIGVQVWNLGTGQSEPHCIGDDRKLPKTTLSPNGELLAAGTCESASDAICEIRVWDIQTGRQVVAPLTSHLGMLSSLVFSPDRQTLASSSLENVIFWNLQTGRPRGLPHRGSGVAFSADGRISALSAPPASQPPRTILLIDSLTDQPIGELTTGEHDVVLGMAFSPDRAALAVSIADTVDHITGVKLWDLSRREPLGGRLEWSGRALVFSPDGKTLIAGSDEHGVAAWDVDPESWRARACAVANRNLTYDEWTQSLGEAPYRAICPALEIDPNMVEAGRKHARAGDIEGAKAIFRRVVALDPTQKIDPQNEAIRFSIERLRANGEYLAASGDLDGAIANFTAAKQLDPDLPLDPSAEARKLAAPRLISESENLAQQGKIAESIAQLARAREFYPALAVPAAAWNTLCWNGSLSGHAPDVTEACDRAVSLEPENGRFHTSRGLARAKLRRVEESISDFQGFLAWAQRTQAQRMGLSQRQWLEAGIQRHERWITALRAGQDPFTPAELQRLRDEDSSDRP